MRYHVLATDYDGTLAQQEKVDAKTIKSLKKLKSSGRKLILVTGRELEELQDLFPEYVLFDRIVAENGALIYRPATLEERLLGEKPPDVFIQKWLYHLQRNDYSKWLRDSVNDEELALRTEKIENEGNNAVLSRKMIFELIQERYTGRA